MCVCVCVSECESVCVCVCVYSCLINKLQILVFHKAMSFHRYCYCYCLYTNNCRNTCSGKY